MMTSVKSVILVHGALVAMNTYASPVTQAILALGARANRHAAVGVRLGPGVPRDRLLVHSVALDFTALEVLPRLCAADHALLVNLAQMEGLRVMEMAT